MSQFQTATSTATVLFDLIRRSYLITVSSETQLKIAINQFENFVQIHSDLLEPDDPISLNVLQILQLNYKF